MYAPLGQAYGGISPYQPIKIVSASTGNTVQQGYMPKSGQSPQDYKIAQELHTIVESIKDFFWENFKHVGLDDQGKISSFYINLSEKNAFYQHKSTGQECFKFHDSYSTCPEVVCHEYAHGVIANTNPLEGYGEQGALNESISDVVAIIFKHRILARIDWKISDLRDLGTQFYMSDLLSTNPTSSDLGNVHHNSRLLSHAFYLAYTSEVFKGDNQNILLKIWWESVQSLDEKEKIFTGFAKKTIAISSGYGAPIQEAIENAWKRVELI